MALFATDLLASPLGRLPFDVVSNTLRRLVAEIDPDDVTLAKLLEAVKTKPAIPDRTRIEGPDTVDPISTGPAARGLAWRRRHGIAPPTNRPQASIRAELAQILSSLGARMKFHCIKCHAEFREVDIDAYVLRCMDAGRDDEPEPPRWCAKCTPVSLSPESDDADVPF